MLLRNRSVLSDVAGWSSARGDGRIEILVTESIVVYMSAVNREKQNVVVASWAH